MRYIVDDQTCADRATRPAEASSQDPEVLRAALLREWSERRRAECLARMQNEIVQLACDELVQQPNIEGFFGALTKTMVEEGDSKGCGVWLINEARDGCHLWMIFVKGQLYVASSPDMNACPESTFPNRAMAAHLFEHNPGWTKTTEYGIDDGRLPEDVRAFTRQHELDGTLATPLVLNGETLGSCSSRPSRGRPRSRSITRASSTCIAARSAARRSSKSATGSPVTSTTISRRGSPRY
jgi:hypothetical protein